LPDNLTLCGLLLALSLIDKVPLMVPVVVGVNRRAKTQLVPAARLLPFVQVVEGE